jgi:hypothetical protein
MTKFTGRADEGYGQVRAVLKRWIDEHARDGLSSEELAEASRANGSGGAQSNGPVFNGPIFRHNVIPSLPAHEPKLRSKARILKQNRHHNCGPKGPQNRVVGSTGQSFARVGE